MQDRQRRVHVREEKLDAVLDHVVREEARSGRERRAARRTVDAVQSVRNLGGERGLSLGLAQLANHLCSRPLGPLLLRNGVVGTGQLSAGAVATRIDAVALHLAAVAGVAGALDRRRGRRRHGGARAVGRLVGEFVRTPARREASLSLSLSRWTRCSILLDTRRPMLDAVHDGTVRLCPRLLTWA
jgi:hypothetical protein